MLGLTTEIFCNVTLSLCVPFLLLHPTGLSVITVPILIIFCWIQRLAFQLFLLSFTVKLHVTFCDCEATSILDDTHPGI